MNLTYLISTNKVTGTCQSGLPSVLLSAEDSCILCFFDFLKEAIQKIKSKTKIIITKNGTNTSKNNVTV